MLSIPIFPSGLVWFLAYLIGSIPFGWLVGRLRGVDIQKEGSGNIGATNVGRVLGKPLGALVLVLDFAKGAICVLLARPLYGLLATLVPAEYGSISAPAALECGAGLAAFLGHCFPIFLGFKGGKGIATATGVVAFLLPQAAVAGLIAFVAVVIATRYVSLACLFAAVILIVAHLIISRGIDFAEPRTQFVFAATAIVFLRHAGNIKRLLAGEERQIRPYAFLPAMARSLHVLSLGLWCGAGMFFSFVTAPILFSEFESLGENPERPTWLPRPAMYASVDDAVNGPKEQGSRIAGYAVGGIFEPYFLWQFVCGIVALGTALSGPRWRTWIIGLAFVLVIAGWPIERKVTELRPLRNETTDAYLRSDDRAATKDAMKSARATFAAWHVVSLFMNMGVMGLVLIATASAGRSPAAALAAGLLEPAKNDVPPTQSVGRSN